MCVIGDGHIQQISLVVYFAKKIPSSCGWTFVQDISEDGPQDRLQSDNGGEFKKDVKRVSRYVNIYFWQMSTYILMSIIYHLEFVKCIPEAYPESSRISMIELFCGNS